jgi:hypothetical protein
VYYCGQQCQRAHRGEHRAACAPPLCGCRHAGLRLCLLRDSEVLERELQRGLDALEERLPYGAVGSGPEERLQVLREALLDLGMPLSPDPAAAAVATNPVYGYTKTVPADQASVYEFILSTERLAAYCPTAHYLQTLAPFVFDTADYRTLFDPV